MTQENKALIIDNGGMYSSHVIYFVDCEGYDPELLADLILDKLAQL